MRLVNADALVSKLEKYSDPTARFRNEYLFGMQRRLETCIKLVEDAPTVDAVPVVHGRWQYHINANNEVNTKGAYCSKCGFYVDVTTTFNFNKYLHCPNCGAKMDGVIKV